MPTPLPPSTLAEAAAPLPIVRRLLAETAASGGDPAAAVSGHFRAALDGKWDEVGRDCRDVHASARAPARPRARAPARPRCCRGART